MFEENGERTSTGLDSVESNTIVFEDRDVCCRKGDSDAALLVACETKEVQTDPVLFWNEQEKSCVETAEVEI